MSRQTPHGSPRPAKCLPALPGGALGLDFSELSRDDGFGRLAHDSNCPPPLTALPRRQASLTPHSPAISPARSPHSPYTPPSIPSSRFPYSLPWSNNSTATALARSTSTLTPASDILNTEEITPRRIVFAKTSVSAETLDESIVDGERQGLTKSGTSLRRKGSSAQLLKGLSKGLNRVGSVMRRNTDPKVVKSELGTGLSQPDLIGSMRSWTSRARRDPAPDGDCAAIDVSQFSGEEGDQAIGRPFNVEHDLHVSEDLEALPSAWIDSLKEQGLTKTDLLLMSAARKKQRDARPLAAYDDFEAARHAFGPTHATSKSYGGSSNTGSLLRNFSFERDLGRSQAADVFGAKPLALDSVTSNPRNTFIQAIDSFSREPAGPGELSVSDEPVVIIGNDRDGSATPVEHLKFRRLSDQLRGFKESTFGLNLDDDWCKSILPAEWRDVPDTDANDKGEAADRAAPSHVSDDRIVPASSSRHAASSSIPPIHNTCSPPPPARHRRPNQLPVVSPTNTPGHSKPTAEVIRPPLSTARRSSNSFGVIPGTPTGLNTGSSTRIRGSQAQRHVVDDVKDDLDVMALLRDHNRDHPHLSLPASARTSSASQSRSPSPKQPLVHVDGGLFAEVTTDGEHPLIPHPLYAGPHQSLDATGQPVHRTSMALSYRSSRTSISAHSTHEEYHATVRMAYKLPGRSKSESVVPSLTSLTGLWGSDGDSHLVEQGSESSAASVQASEEGEARDAMDALGEAARRLKGA
ncbi:hypothetical protein IAU60_001316 [Kwoniella sp. DSM 27419]